MIRTRVGYSGGTTASPTYHNLGDHAETVEVDFDPSQVSYEKLLSEFWAGHSPIAPSPKRQYMSAVFYHGEGQRRQALESMRREEERRGIRLYTEVLPATRFYLAEDYHQKYRLRLVPELLGDFEAIYPDTAGFVNSTAAAKVNAYVSGHGTTEGLENDIASLGLSPEGEKKLREIVHGWQSRREKWAEH